MRNEVINIKWYGIDEIPSDIYEDVRNNFYGIKDVLVKRKDGITAVVALVDKDKFASNYLGTRASDYEFYMGDCSEIVVDDVHDFINDKEFIFMDLNVIEEFGDFDYGEITLFDDVAEVALIPDNAPAMAMYLYR